MVSKLIQWRFISYADLNRLKMCCSVREKLFDHCVIFFFLILMTLIRELWLDVDQGKARKKERKMHK
ncbi:hypothetical protein SDJN02_05790, partial [Cucurbita argyrosperma subsp. argyrosperma]